MQGGDYSYDNDGRLIEDINKGISSIIYNHLDKPYQILLDNNRSITYIYDAMGNRIQKIITQDDGENNYTTYIGGIEYYEPTPSNPNTEEPTIHIMHPYGRTRMQENVLTNTTEYINDYYVRDHLGSVRALVTEDASSGVVNEAIAVTYSATHEQSQQQVEDALFDDNIHPMTFKPGGNLQDTRCIVLNGNDPDRIIGTSLLLKVMAGDLYKIKTESYLTSGTGQSIDPNMLINAISGAIGATNAVTGTESGTSIINNILNSPNLYSQIAQAMGANPTSSLPDAGLVYLFFDQNYELIPSASGMHYVSNAGQWETIGDWNMLTEIDQNGYLLVMHVNNTEHKNVYFDHFQMKYHRSSMKSDGPA